ncbi:vomeronasal type-1 receptor 90-like [Ctenodactylus gundi]
MNEDNKLYTFIAIKNAFFSQVGVGISANTVLFLFHMFMFLLRHRPKPTDLTIGHLALIHLLMLLIMGVIATDIFGSQWHWDDLLCKSAVSLYRLMRGLSLCTTCLLSVLQAVTLSPTSSRLAKFKHRSSSENLCCFFFLWVFNTFISSRFLISAVATLNGTSDGLLFVTESCSLWPLSYFLRLFFSALVTFRDVSLIGIMSVSSGYMVTLLCRHKKQSQHLHGTSLLPKASPELRATWAILLLMSFFVIMYFVDCIISFFLGMLWNKDPVRLCVQMLVTNCYATISPLVLLSTERRKVKFLKSMLGRDSKHLIIK